MAENRRVNVKQILGDPDLRRRLMVSTIQATQAREGIETSEDQAKRAYYVVSEGEKANFFDLERFRAGVAGTEQRQAAFILALRGSDAGVRFELPRRDFFLVDTAPLAYRRIGPVSHLFRELPPLEPATGLAKQGLATTDDERWLRRFWEVASTQRGTGKAWVPFAKGGEFSRFYFDNDLVILWANNGRDLKDYIVSKEGSETKRIYSQDWYFKRGVTWPYRSQKGFSPRLLPGDGIHGHVGHSVFPRSPESVFYILGVFASHLFSYLLGFFSAFGKYEIGMVKKLPVPLPGSALGDQIKAIAESIYESKLAWDRGNEVSTAFERPWIVEPSSGMVRERLAAVAELEESRTSRIRLLYADLNDHVFKLYGIPDRTRKVVEETLGDQPDEVVWPQMEGKTPDQKRMEHVWRLLSFAVKRVVEADGDGVVPLLSLAGEISLADRVHVELAKLFPAQDVNEVEIEIVNELKRKVKGYDRVESIREWIENVYFAYHASLYKSRPVFWHIASKQGKGSAAFSALIQYHKFNKDRMARLRGGYLREALTVFRRESALAGQEGRADDRLEWQAKVEEAEELDRRLQLVQEGFHNGSVDYRILTPWKTETPRPKGWDPDFNDGVKVNIAPLQRAGVLRILQVVAE